MPKLAPYYCSEKWLERQLVDIIKSLGGECLKLYTISVTGLPDRLALLPGGQTFFVEVKSQGQKPRAIQSWWHNKLRGLGFTVLIVDSVESLEHAKVYATEISRGRS